MGGRAVEVVAYECERPLLIPALWLGGMASHGLLPGGIAACLTTLAAAAGGSSR